MAGHDVVIVGTGPAGVHAAITIANSGLRPIVIDEAPQAGGQIFRRPPATIGTGGGAILRVRSGKGEASPRNLRRSRRSASTTGAAPSSGRPSRVACIWFPAKTATSIAWSHLLVASGAMDRIIPVKGWTLPGVWTLGAAQIAPQGATVGVGRRVLFFGTGRFSILSPTNTAKRASKSPVWSTLPHRERGVPRSSD